MRDLMADWNKWSSAERLLAVVLMLMLIGLPFTSFYRPGSELGGRGQGSSAFLLCYTCVQGMKIARGIMIRAGTFTCLHARA